MSTVHLESDDGISIQLAAVDANLPDTADRIAALAADAPVIAAVPSGAQMGIGANIRARTDFNCEEITAAHEVVAFLLDDLGVADHRLVQSAPDVFVLDEVIFTKLTVVDGADSTSFDLLPADSDEFHLAGTANDHDQSTHAGGAASKLRRAARAILPVFDPDSTLNQTLPKRWENHRTPDETLWAQRDQAARLSNAVVPTRDDRNTRAGDLFGAGVGQTTDDTLDVLFPNGALTTTTPWRAASRTKKDRPFDQELVNETLAADRLLTDVDPRVLRATQSGLTRDGVRYYLGDEYRRTGTTYADQYQRGNAYPVVYKNPKGQYMLLSGHHRAAAALLQARQLRAVVIDPDKGPPPRRTVV